MTFALGGALGAWSGSRPRQVSGTCAVSGWRVYAFSHASSSSLIYFSALRCRPTKRLSAHYLWPLDCAVFGLSCERLRRAIGGGGDRLFGAALIVLVGARESVEPALAGLA